MIPRALDSSWVDYGAGIAVGVTLTVGAYEDWAFWLRVGVAAIAALLVGYITAMLVDFVGWLRGKVGR